MIDFEHVLEIYIHIWFLKVLLGFIVFTAFIYVIAFKTMIYDFLWFRNFEGKDKVGIPHFEGELNENEIKEELNRLLRLNNDSPAVLARIVELEKMADNLAYEQSVKNDTCKEGSINLEEVKK